MKTLISLTFCAISFGAYAQFSGAGEGTQESPYIITNSVELNQLRSISTSSETYFELGNDIDMTAWIEDNNPKLGFNPIPSFSGNLDGKGHAIKFFINRPKVDKVGLFAELLNAKISNLRIEADVTGNNLVGGLAGSSIANSSVGVTINECYFSGTVIGNAYTGGIIGKFGAESGKTANLESCKTAGTIKGGSYVGGITGRTVGNLSHCYSRCSVEATGDYVGGIVGYTTGYTYGVSTTYSYYYSSKSGSTTNCLSEGNVTGVNYVGGISGYCYGYTMTTNLNKGKVSGTSYVGGISGYFSGGYQNSNNIHSYINSNVCVCETITASSSDGYRIGFLGTDYAHFGTIGTTSENKALNATVVTVAGEAREVEGDDAQDGSNNGTKAMKKASTYTGIGWDMTETWGIDEGKGYPYLLGFTDYEPEYQDSEYDEYEAPTISIVKGKVEFNCELENPTYYYKIAYQDSEYAEAESPVGLPSTLKLYVYAANDTERTPIACYDILALNYDLNFDTKITAADVTLLVDKVLEIEREEEDE